MAAVAHCLQTKKRGLGTCLQQYDFAGDVLIGVEFV
jgi:hypothetical protein